MMSCFASYFNVSKGSEADVVNGMGARGADDAGARRVRRRGRMRRAVPGRAPVPTRGAPGPRDPDARPARRSRPEPTPAAGGGDRDGTPRDRPRPARRGGDHAGARLAQPDDLL